MKLKIKKFGNFLAGKSFYLVLAGCLVATGVAAWTAYSSVTTPKPDTDTISAPDYSSSAPETNEAPAGTDASELYSSTEEVSEPENAEPVAEAYIMPMGGEILKPYSDTDLVFSKTFKDMRLHTGLDIKGSEGQTVKSCGDGKVVAIIEEPLLGTYVEIDHGNGTIARYCGLKNDLAVAEGDTVEAGQKLGVLGEIPSECEDESHLHLEFYHDEYPLDPLVIINGEQ